MVIVNVKYITYNLPTAPSKPIIEVGPGAEDIEDRYGGKFDKRGSNKGIWFHFRLRFTDYHVAVGAGSSDNCCPMPNQLLICLSISYHDLPFQPPPTLLKMAATQLEHFTLSHRLGWSP